MSSATITGGGRGELRTRPGGSQGMTSQATGQPIGQDKKRAKDGDVPPSPSAFATLKWAIDQARRDLLDPSRRNRLLHAPLTGKRPWCMAVVGHDPDDLFQSLSRLDNFGGFAFNPIPEEQGESVAENSTPKLLLVSDSFPRGARSRPSRASAGSVASNGRLRLQTRLDGEKLERRLPKYFAKNARLRRNRASAHSIWRLVFLSGLTVIKAKKRHSRRLSSCR